MSFRFSRNGRTQSPQMAISLWILLFDSNQIVRQTQRPPLPGVYFCSIFLHTIFFFFMGSQANQHKRLAAKKNAVSFWSRSKEEGNQSLSNFHAFSCPLSYLRDWLAKHVASSSKPLRASTLCGFCGVYCTTLCGACKRVRYCNATCQSHHWKIHKLACKQKTTDTPTNQN